jgi:death-on-curing protein
MAGEPAWLPRLAVEAMHHDQLLEHGGLPGLRDEDAFEAALARPRHRFAYDPGADLPALAAAYGHGLAAGHAFNDGNKRTAFLAMYTFLGLNGRELEAPEPEVVRVMVDLAAGRLTEDGLAGWLRERLAPLAQEARDDR